MTVAPRATLSPSDHGGSRTPPPRHIMAAITPDGRLVSRRAAGPGPATSIRLPPPDDRDTDGRGDRIVSIAMRETVGKASWPTFLRTPRDGFAHRDGGFRAGAIDVDFRRLRHAAT